MTTPIHRKTLLLILVAGIALSAATVGAYRLFARFLRDRETISAFDRRPRADPSARRPTREVTEFHYDDKGNRIETRSTKGQRQSPSAPVPPSGQDAVQRSLKTVEEINRMNEMNRRLMEEQERIRRQNRQ